MTSLETPSLEKEIPLHEEAVGGRAPERTVTEVTGNLRYDDIEEEPELHARTYVALAALFVLNMVQVIALTGPPSILAYIGSDLNGTQDQTWVPNVLSLVQAVGGPLISFASDTFQARKTLIVVPCTISFIGAAIAPGAKDIYRVIAAQTLIGFGFACVPLAYSIPSEIVPRRWRPLVQSAMNIAAAVGATISPLICGALTRNNPHTGWRNFYWFQMAMWGFCVVGVIVGYRPPRRHTRLDHLSLREKIGRLDIPGMLLLAAAITLLLTGLSLGDNPWPWGSARPLATLISGIVLLIAFGLYEWRGTSTGILHHDLFSQGRTFPLCIALIFIEGIMLFSIIVFYPALTTALFEQDPFLAGARGTPFWVCSGLSTMFYGFWSYKRRTIRSPLATGFVLFTAGLVGLATIKPNQSTNAILFDGLAGLGFGSLLILIITGVQLGTPHHLIATATAVVTSSRAVAAATFTAIYGAALNTQTAKRIPSYIASAAVQAGLPPTSVGGFVGALAGQDQAALASVPGVTPSIIGAGVAALMNALADSFRYVYIIAAPFGLVGVFLCYFLGDMTKTMHYKVDAPMEELRAKNQEKATVV